MPPALISTALPRQHRGTGHAPSSKLLAPLRWGLKGHGKSFCIDQKVEGCEVWVPPRAKYADGGHGRRDPRLDRQRCPRRTPRRGRIPCCRGFPRHTRDSVGVRLTVSKTSLSSKTPSPAISAAFAVLAVKAGTGSEKKVNIINATDRNISAKLYRFGTKSAEITVDSDIAGFRVPKCT